MTVERYERLDEVRNPLGSTAAEWSAKWFGGPTRVIDSNVTVTAGVVQILQNNPRRLFWMLSNRSSNPIGVGFARAVTDTNGLLMPANAGAISMAVQEDGESVAWEVFVFATSGPSLINIIEIVRV